MSTHSLRGIIQPFMPIYCPFLTNHVFSCPFQFFIKPLLWGCYLSVHCWTFWPVNCISWSEEIWLGCPYWSYIFCSGYFIVLRVYIYRRVQPGVSVDSCKGNFVAPWGYWQLFFSYLQVCLPPGNLSHSHLQSLVFLFWQSESSHWHFMPQEV